MYHPPSTFESAESIAFSADDNLLAVGSRRGVTQVFQRRNTGRWIGYAEFKHEQGLWGLSFAKDNLIYVVGHSGHLEYWDCALPIDRRNIKLLPAETSAKVQIDDSPKVRASNWTAARAYERAVAFHRRLGDPVYLYGDRAKIETMTAGRRLLVSSFANRSLQVLDSETCAPIFEHFQAGEYVSRPILSDDERQIALASQPNRFTLFQSQSLDALKTGQYPPDALVTSASFSSDQSKIYLNLKGLPPLNLPSKSILVYDAANLQEVAFAYDFPLRELEAQPLYTSRAIQCIVERHSHPLTRVVTDEIRTGQVAWVGCSETEDLFVCASYRSGLRIFHGSNLDHPTNVPLIDSPCAFAINPDGTLIASCEICNYGSSAPNVLRLFDTVTGRELLSLNHHMLEPWDVCFSKDGQHLMLVGTGVSGHLELAIWGD